MYHKTVFSFAMIFLLFSCGSNSSKGKLELNNGEKWTIIESMVVHIRAMENDVTSFENSPEKDYPILAENLQKNIDLLISSCTMKGKAHDELHKWLLPHIDLVKALSNAKDNEAATEVFKQIQNSFKTFNQYFQ